MKRISHKLSSWWFSTLILIRTPPTTIGAGVQFDPRVVQAFTKMLLASQREEQQSFQMADKKS